MLSGPLEFSLRPEHYFPLRILFRGHLDKNKTKNLRKVYRSEPAFVPLIPDQLWG